MQLNLRILNGSLLEQALKLSHAIDRPLDSLEVTQATTEPTRRNKERTTTRSLLFYDILCLLLCSYKEHISTERHTVNDVLSSDFPPLHGDVEIDNVNPVTSAVDIRQHLRVPTLRLVPVVSACVYKILN
jgi:hypothetical protein